MKRLGIVLTTALLAFAAAACSGTPGSTIALPTGLPTALPSELASLAGQGIGEACNETSESSLSGVADRLRNVGEDADTGAMIDAIAVLLTNLQQADVSDAAETARNEAINQLREVQSALAEPGTAGDAANSAADALESLEAEVCS